MALRTYASIDDTQTDPEAPYTSELAKALAENLAATMQGHSNVPDNERGRAELFTRLVAGSDTAFLAPDEVDVGVTAWTEVAKWGFVQGGTVRVDIQYKRGTATSGNLRLVRSRNGTDTVLDAPSSFTNTSYSTYSIDVTVQVGDVLRIDGMANFVGSGPETITFRNFEIGVDQVQLLPWEGRAGWRNQTLV